MERNQVSLKAKYMPPKLTHAPVSRKWEQGCEYFIDNKRPRGLYADDFFKVFSDIIGFCGKSEAG